MYFCDVYIGDVCLGNTNYRLPPIKPLTNSENRQFIRTSSQKQLFKHEKHIIMRTRYDTMVDNFGNPKIFVTTRNFQAYPSFLVEFVRN